LEGEKHLPKQSQRDNWTKKEEYVSLLFARNMILPGIDKTPMHQFFT